MQDGTVLCQDFQRVKCKAHQCAVITKKTRVCGSPIKGLKTVVWGKGLRVPWGALGAPLMAHLMSSPIALVTWRTLTVDWLFGKEHDLSRVACQEAIGQQLQEV